MGGTCRTHGGREKYILDGERNLAGRTHCGDLFIGRKIMLK